VRIAANAIVREDQNYLLAVHRERRGHFRPDEASPDDDEAITALGQAPHPLVIVEGAVVDDLVAANDHVGIVWHGCSRDEGNDRLSEEVRTRARALRML